MENLREAMTIWQEIKLGELQKELDKTGQEIISSQKESQASRKALAEQTKEFKKLSEAERPEAFKTLLKSYQTEIDNLTKRSKNAETAFLSLYRVFADAPDPAKMLETLMAQNDKIQQVEVLLTENKRLREELDNSNKEFVDLKTKASAASRLKDKLTELENKMEHIVQEKVKERENLLKEEFNAKLKVYKEREYEVERQLSRMKDEMEALYSNNNLNQATIFAHSIKFDQTVSAKLAELEIVENELERANEKIATLERELEAKKTAISQFSSNITQSDQDSVAQKELAQKLRRYEETIFQKESEIMKLSEDVQMYKGKVALRNVSHLSFVSDLEAKIADLQEEIEKLNDKLSERKDYDEIKKELEILKYIEFAADQENTEEIKGEVRIEIDGLTPKEPSNGDARTLEQLLISKNKKLQSEATAFKVKAEELAAELKQASQREEAAKGVIQEQRKLIDKLEDDVCTLNDISIQNEQGNHPSLPGSSSGNNVTTATVATTPNLNPTGVNAGTTTSPNASLTAILTSQRDRYKKRVKEVEEQLKECQMQNQEMNLRIETLTNDNVKLYENIRYLQSYRQTHQTLINIPQANDVTTKYRNAYEEKINPFAAFSEREKLQRFNNLSVPEKITVNIGRAIISNKYGRVFVFFYTLILHGFVLFIVHKMSITEECRHDHAIELANTQTLI